MDKVLVTGGAGYVGSHACLRLAEAGFEPVTVDNLSNGRRDFVRWGPFEPGDIRDADRMSQVFAAHKVVAVMHFAALIDVADSVKHPERFADNNIRGAFTVIDAALAAGVHALVFSSTCATYGAPLRPSIDETHPQAPLSPYGETKLAVERRLNALDGQGSLRSVALRYFNAAGANPEAGLGEAHDPETHAIPLAIQTALGERARFQVFGGDYETRDGTAIRDYVHVLDLADAHVLALRWLLDGGRSDVFNLGAGIGTSVYEMLNAVQLVSGREIPTQVIGRRPGDAPVLVADAAKARAQLGWRPGFSLEEIVASAWSWHSGQGDLARRRQ